ncbi:hypothetical protein KAR91_01020 [Candidatus Pacearchaeota archaeon]|nr:hypothetical protein [Candidatus Pacearchaeota archaeon]
MIVYVVQNQMRFDREKGELVPRFNLSSAEQYGELSYLLSPSASPFNPEGVLKEMAERLADFTSEDYLLLVGNPVLIGMASALAADIAGVVQFLQWSGKDQKYITIRAEVFPDCVQQEG